MSHKDPEKGPNHKTRGEHKGAEQSYNKCFGMSPESEGKDHPCIFPFIYRGIVSEFQLHLPEMLKIILKYVNLTLLMLRIPYYFHVYVHQSREDFGVMSFYL